MPSSEAQAALIKYVYTSHGLDYESTQYVEAHVSCIKKMRTSTIIKSELTDV
jgi:acyl transferase domain-containing protein